MNYNIEIKRAVTSTLNTLLNANIIKWPNSNFSTPNDVNWLAVHIMTGDTFEADLSTSDLVNGIIQVDVMMPKHSGENFAYTTADILTTGLPKNGTSIANGSTEVHIRSIRQPRLVQDPNWHKMIIDINFYSFVPRQ